MKNAILILVMIFLSCKSVKSEPEIPQQNDLLVYYSKGRCLGKCPVFDLWIYNNGSFKYIGVDNVSYKGEIKDVIPPNDLVELKYLIKDNDIKSYPFKKGYDLPVTTLRYNQVELKYYSSSVKKSLLKLNTKMEELVDQINKI